MEREIRADLFRYGKSRDATGFIKALRFPGFRYTYLFRKAAKYGNRSIRGSIYELLMRRYGYKYGFQIPSSTSIGEGFYIGHFGTVVINGNTKIGKNCNVAHGVTIGRTNRGSRKGYPTLGNRVWIGTGSVIVGNVRIGNNVLIAPNSFVNVDVPDNSLVIGNPASILQKTNPTDGYINNILE